MGVRALALALIALAACVVVSGSALSAGASSKPAQKSSATSVGRPQPAGPAVTGTSGPQPSSGVGVGIATTAAESAVPAASAAPAGPATPAWLAEINRYRIASGLDPVVDQPSWDAGIQAHLNYVAKAPKSDLVGPYLSLHTENPNSAQYTAEGALEAGRSDLYFGASGLTPSAFIDGWLSAPFHAIGMLRARLTTVAFAASGPSAAGLDVIGGLDDSRSGRHVADPVPGQRDDHQSGQVHRR